MYFGLIRLNIEIASLTPYLTFTAKKSIYLESQHEGALQRLYQLEDGSRHQRRQTADDTVSQGPVFTQPVRDLRTAENQAAHFEARLIPVGDARLTVQWLRNGVPIQACKLLFWFLSSNRE